MAQPFIEHVNLTVSDPARTAQLMIGLFGWHIRWEGPAQNGGHSIHVGSENAYLALYSNVESRGRANFPKGRPLNHIGVQVDDLDAVEATAVALGMPPFNHDNYGPGRRFYLLDPDGVEFEIVSYRGN